MPKSKSLEENKSLSFWAGTEDSFHEAIDIHKRVKATSSEELQSIKANFMASNYTDDMADHSNPMVQVEGGVAYVSVVGPLVSSGREFTY